MCLSKQTLSTNFSVNIKFKVLGKRTITQSRVLSAHLQSLTYLRPKDLLHTNLFL